MKTLRRTTCFVIIALMVMTLYMMLYTDKSHADDSIEPPEVTTMNVWTSVNGDYDYYYLYAAVLYIQLECRTDLPPDSVKAGVHIYVNDELIEDLQSEEDSIYQDYKYDEESGTEIPVLTTYLNTSINPVSNEDVTIKAVPYITANGKTVTGSEKTSTVSYDSFHTQTSVEGTTYEYDIESHTLTISGKKTGAFETYPLTGIGRIAKHLVFTEGVTSFEYASGLALPNVTDISLPDSFVQFNDMCFCNYTSLTSISIPPNIKYLEGFTNCTSLSEVIIRGDKIETIGSNAFQNCTSLTSFNVPKSVNTIGADAFAGCTSLKKLIIPKTVMNISGGFCDGCSEDLVFDTPTGSMGYMYANAYDIPVAHEFGEWEVKKEATDDEDGLKERVCSNCGEAEQEVIPKLKPDTGEVTEEEFNNVKTELEEVKGKLATAEGKLATVIQELDTAKTDLADARTRLEEAEGKLAAAETELATAKANLETAERKVAELTGKLSELESKQAQAELKQAESEKAIAALQLSVAELNQRLTKAETDAADAKVEAAESKVKELELEKTVAELQLKLAVATTKVTVSKLTPGKKVLTVKWTVKGDVKEGFEIQYALNKTFKSPKKITVKSSTARSRKIKSLKSGKKYFVRVRSYKEVEGKKYYTDWSKAKSAKIK